MEHWLNKSELKVIRKNVLYDKYCSGKNTEYLFTLKIVYAKIRDESSLILIFKNN